MLVWCCRSGDLGRRNTGWGRNMGVATASWAVICTLFLLVPYAGPIPFSLLMSAIAILAVREFYKMSGICGFMRLATASLFIIAMADRPGVQQRYSLSTGSRSLP